MIVSLPPNALSCVTKSIKKIFFPISLFSLRMSPIRFC